MSNATQTGGGFGCLLFRERWRLPRQSSAKAGPGRQEADRRARPHGSTTTGKRTWSGARRPSSLGAGEEGAPFAGSAAFGMKIRLSKSVWRSRPRLSLNFAQENFFVFGLLRIDLDGWELPRLPEWGQPKGQSPKSRFQSRRLGTSAPYQKSSRR